MDMLLVNKLVIKFRMWMGEITYIQLRESIVELGTEWVWLIWMVFGQNERNSLELER